MELVVKNPPAKAGDKRDVGLIPGSGLFEDNPVDEGTTKGALTPLCIVQKNPQVPHTALQEACHPVNNSRCKRISIPPHKMSPDSPLPSL